MLKKKKSGYIWLLKHTKGIFCVWGGAGALAPLLFQACYDQLAFRQTMCEYIWGMQLLNSVWESLFCWAEYSEIMNDSKVLQTNNFVNFMGKKKQQQQNRALNKGEIWSAERSFHIMYRQSHKDYLKDMQTIISAETPFSSTNSIGFSVVTVAKGRFS